MSLPLVLSALCNCGDDCDVTPSMYKGSLVYQGVGVTGVDGGAPASSSMVTTSGGVAVVADVDAFSPTGDNKSNDPGGYCGPKTLTIAFGPACIVHADLGTTYYDTLRTFVSADATVSADSPCSVTVGDEAQLTLTVQSGVVHFAPETVEIDLTGSSTASTTASLHFEGVEQ